MQLPQIVAEDRDLQLMQTKWRSILNPILSIPFLSGNQVSKVVLKSGNNTINTGLKQAWSGWFITDMQGASVSLYSIPDKNPSATTLTLYSSGIATIDLWVW